MKSICEILNYNLGEMNMVLKKEIFINTKTFLKITLLIIFCTFFAICNSSILHSKRSDTKSLEYREAISLIQAKYRNNLSPINLLIYRSPMKSGTIIKSAFSSENKDNDSIICDEKCWLFVADFSPKSAFQHKIEIGVFSKINQYIPKIIESKWWPEIIVKGKPELLYLNLPEWEKINLEFPKKLIPDSSVLLFIDTVSKSFLRQFFSDCISISKIYIKGEAPLIKKIGNPNASKKLWVILICGCKEYKGDITFSYDTNDMYSILMNYGVLKKKIFYITPNKSLLKKKYKVFDEELSKCSVQKCFDKIKKKILPNEKLLFFISTHGSPEMLTLQKNRNYSEYLTPCLLKNFLDEVHCKTQFIVINACSSGSFGAILINGVNKNTNRIVITSSDIKSYFDLDHEIYDPNSKDRGSEFISGFIESFSDMSVIKMKKNADEFPEDQKISIYEAFIYAKNHSCCAENPSTLRFFSKHYYSPNIVKSGGTNLKNEFLFWESENKK